MPVPSPNDPFHVFFALTGVTFLAFTTGFSVCLFDLDQIGACVDYAEGALEILKRGGDHVVDWFLALLGEVRERNNF